MFLQVWLRVISKISLMFLLFMKTCLDYVVHSDKSKHQRDEGEAVVLLEPVFSWFIIVTFATLQHVELGGTLRAWFVHSLWLYVQIPRPDVLKWLDHGQYKSLKVKCYITISKSTAFVDDRWTPEYQVWFTSSIQRAIEQRTHPGAIWVAGHGHSVWCFLVHHTKQSEEKTQNLLQQTILIILFYPNIAFGLCWNWYEDNSKYLIGNFGWLSSNGLPT